MYRQNLTGLHVTNRPDAHVGPQPALLHDVLDSVSEDPGDRYELDVILGETLVDVQIPLQHANRHGPSGGVIDLGVDHMERQRRPDDAEDDSGNHQSGIGEWAGFLRLLIGHGHFPSVLSPGASTSDCWSTTMPMDTVHMRPPGLWRMLMIRAQPAFSTINVRPGVPSLIGS